jgi:hypothetical protein
MNISKSYIILLSDNPNTAKDVKNLLRGLHNTFIEVVETIEALFHLIKQNRPKAILIHHHPETGYVNDLKGIRNNLSLDTIPIMVFSELPSLEEIITLCSS